MISGLKNSTPSTLDLTTCDFDQSSELTKMTNIKYMPDLFGSQYDLTIKRDDSCVQICFGEIRTNGPVVLDVIRVGVSIFQGTPKT